VRQPGEDPQQERAPHRNGTPHGSDPWTQLRTRPGAWPTSWPIRRCGFDLAAKETELAELTARSADPNLWDDQANAQALLRRADELRDEIGVWRDLEARARGLAEMAELASADADGAGMQADLERDLASLQADWGRMQSELLLSEPHDRSSAIVFFFNDTGGTESQDWAEMLLRMYLRWAEGHRYHTEILDQTEGE